MTPLAFLPPSPLSSDSGLNSNPVSINLDLNFIIKFNNHSSWHRDQSLMLLAEITRILNSLLLELVLFIEM